MSQKPSQKPHGGSGEVCMRRAAFLLLVIHWALIVLAAPFIVFFQSEKLFWYYLLFTFLSTLILWAATPARSIFVGRNEIRDPCPTLGKFPSVLRALWFGSLLCIGVSMILLGDGGPGIQDGVYCLWNHGFVREITEAEYLHLRRAERFLGCSLLVGFRTWLMWIWCYVDRIL